MDEYLGRANLVVGEEMTQQSFVQTSTSQPLPLRCEEWLRLGVADANQLSQIASLALYNSGQVSASMNTT